MAVAPGFIGNATDGIGQGLAFVLPQSNTEKYAMQLGQQHAADLRNAALQQQKQQQLLQAQYQKDLAAQKLPEYWAQAGKPINDQWNQYLTDAAAYQAKTGRSPFGNPEFEQRKNDILLKARQSKELEQSIGKLLPMVAADHDNRFTEDSKQQVNQFVQGALAKPTDYFGKPAPQLQGTPSGIDDFNKLIKPVHIEQGNGTVKTIVPDTSSMMQQAYVNSADPRWNNLKKTKYGIDPELGDIGSVYDKNGKRVWYTNAQATDHIAQQMLDNPTEAHNAEVLTKLGIAPGDTYAKEKLQAAITKQNAGYGQFISDAGKYGTSLVNKSRVVTPDKYNEHLWDKYRFDQAHPAEDDDRDKFIQQVQQGDQASTDKLIRAANAAGGHFSPSTNGFTITMPGKPGATTEVPVLDERHTIPDPNDASKTIPNPQLGKPIINDKTGKPLTKKVKDEQVFTITDGEAGKTVANSLLNHLDLFKKRPEFDKKHRIPTTPAGTPLVNKSKKAATDYGL